MAGTMERSVSRAKTRKKAKEKKDLSRRPKYYKMEKIRDTPIAIVSLKGLSGQDLKDAQKHNDWAIKENAKQATRKQKRLEQGLKELEEKHGETLDKYEHGWVLPELMGEEYQQKIKRGGIVRKKKYSRGGGVRKARF
jgi:hypothetical protein|tara:strand:+ start:115 stop:528 length:414 start_codon:yes stop_codon:yes gene_type:complete